MSAVLLSIVRHMHWLSTTIQLVGTVVTGYGLLYAYGRAKRLPARLIAWFRRILHRPRNIVIGALPTIIKVDTGTADVNIEFKLDENATTEQQFAQLQTYVRELRGMFVPINAAIDRLDKAVEQAREHADTVAAQALTDAKTELQRFRDELNEIQAVDLRIAAVGAFIMAAGYLLSYFGSFRF